MTQPHLHYLHCKKCIAEKPHDKSAQEYARIGAAIDGMVGRMLIMCMRHNEMIGSFLLVELPDVQCGACAAAEEERKAAARPTN